MKYYHNQVIVRLQLYLTQYIQDYTIFYFFEFRFSIKKIQYLNLYFQTECVENGREKEKKRKMYQVDTKRNHF